MHHPWKEEDKCKSSKGRGGVSDWTCIVKERDEGTYTMKCYRPLAADPH